MTHSFHAITLLSLSVIIVSLIAEALTLSFFVFIIIFIPPVFWRLDMVTLSVHLYTASPSDDQGQALIIKKKQLNYCGRVPSVICEERERGWSSHLFKYVFERESLISWF